MTPSSGISFISSRTSSMFFSFEITSVTRSANLSRSTASAPPAGRPPPMTVTGLRIHEEFERGRNEALHILAMDNRVDHSMFDEELASLEAFRELLPDGLFDNSRSRESDERAWFGDIEVAQH